MTNMEYKTVVAENDIVLDRYVNKLITEGWKPLGGASVSVRFQNSSAAKLVYVQAMVKEPKYFLVDRGEQEE